MPDLFDEGENPTHEQVDWFKHLDTTNGNPNLIVLNDHESPMQKQAEGVYDSGQKNSPNEKFFFGTPVGKKDLDLGSSGMNSQ